MYGMWELDYKESWAQKNWCFWTEILEKTLGSPLDCKKIQLVHSKGDQSWVSVWGTDVEAETPILWPPGGESWLIWKDSDAGKDWGQKERRTTEGEMVGWHHQLNGHGFGWTPGVGDGQGGLASCGSWGCKELDMAEWLNWTEPDFSSSFIHSLVKPRIWNVNISIRSDHPSLFRLDCLHVCGDVERLRTQSLTLTVHSWSRGPTCLKGSEVRAGDT